MSKCTIDLNFLKQNSFGDVSLYKELLEIFVKSTPEMLVQIKNAAEQNDFVLVGKVAHKLKSNVQSVGLSNIYELLDNLEALKHNSNIDADFRAALSAINECCNIAVLEIEEELKLL
jgi:HPt (histidine-containing phosphotransfer) domain-containing protein